MFHRFHARQEVVAHNLKQFSDQRLPRLLLLRGIQCGEIAHFSGDHRRQWYTITVENTVAGLRRDALAWRNDAGEVERIGGGEGE